MRSIFFTALIALALMGSAHAADFFDSTLTIQGRTLDLGEAGRTEDYTIFVTNGTLNANASSVDGNVGVNGGPINLNGGAGVSGDAALTTGSNFNVAGGSSIDGTREQGSSFNAKLNSGTSAANAFSSTAASLSATSNYSASSSLGSNLALNRSNLTITAKDNNPVVLKLDNFTINSGTFTLVGTAMTKYIIDISQSFSLDSATIQLSGGLLASNVVFNVEQGNANLNNSKVSGIVLATNAGASLNNSTVTGELIAKVVNLNGGSKVKKPARPSP